MQTVSALVDKTQEKKATTTSVLIVRNRAYISIPPLTRSLLVARISAFAAFAQGAALAAEFKTFGTVVLG